MRANHIITRRITYMHVSFPLILACCTFTHAASIFKFDEERVLRDEFEKYEHFQQGFSRNVIPKHDGLVIPLHAHTSTTLQLFHPCMSEPKAVKSLFGMQMELAGGCWQIPGFAQNNPISDLNDIYQGDSRRAAAGEEARFGFR